jgi:hypothetical protein
MSSVKGSCLCRAVKYEITGPILGPANCHCTMCRKQHGAAFRSRARVKASDFHWIEGEDQVTFYESSPGTRRGFCRNCGSPVVNKVDTNSVSGKFNPAGETSMLGVQLGGLDDDPGVTPGVHVFVANKAPWFTITDDLPQYPQMPD